MIEKLTSFYPVVSVEDVRSASGFFTTHLGFDTSFESEWYTSLRRDGFELGILRWDHPSVPAAYRRASAGLVLTLEADDADAANERLVVGAGLPVVQELRSEDFGQRHVIIEGPEGVLIDIVQPIKPSAEFAAGYAEPQAAADHPDSARR